MAEMATTRPDQQPLPLPDVQADAAPETGQLPPEFRQQYAALRRQLRVAAARSAVALLERHAADIPDGADALARARQALEQALATPPAALRDRPPRDRPPIEGAPAADAAAYVDDYDNRRCHFCSRHPAFFGFGPPLTPWAETRWTCADHRADMERLIAASEPSALSDAKDHTDA